MVGGRQRDAVTRRRLSPDEDRAVAEEFRGGLTAAEIARLRDLPHHVIANSLRRSGLRAADRWGNTLKGPKVISPEIIAEVLEFGRSASIEKTASHFGLSIRRTKSLLGYRRRLGGYRFQLSGRPRREVVQEMAARWDAGETKQSIGRALDLSKRTVSKILREVRSESHVGIVSGPRHWSWKGGRRVTNQGYVVVIIPKDHPFYEAMRPRSGPAYVLEHRLTMAELLGRPLLPNETVHHINGVRFQNEPENLQLRIGKHGPGAQFRCGSCGSCNIIPERLTAGNASEISWLTDIPSTASL